MLCESGNIVLALSQQGKTCISLLGKSERGFVGRSHGDRHGESSVPGGSGWRAGRAEIAIQEWMSPRPPASPSVDGATWCQADLTMEPWVRDLTPSGLTLSSWDPD